MCVNWAEYQTAYGRAEEVGSQLLALNSAEHDTAMRASHDLWCGLCHQYAYVTSAALPSYPFLVEILNNASEELQIEILDILLGFAVCSKSDNSVAGTEELNWRNALQSTLMSDIKIYEELARSQNEQVRDFAERIVSSLLLDETHHIEKQPDIFNEVKPRD